MKTTGRYAVALSIGLIIGVLLGGNSQGHNANAQSAQNAATARFQISAFGTETNGSGCYIVDTQTGALWLSRGGMSYPKKITDKMPQELPSN